MPILNKNVSLEDGEQVALLCKSGDLSSIPEPQVKMDKEI